MMQMNLNPKLPHMPTTVYVEERVYVPELQLCVATTESYGDGRPFRAS